jgi:hypothetical protein
LAEWLIVEGLRVTGWYIFGNTSGRISKEVITFGEVIIDQTISRVVHLIVSARRKVNHPLEVARKQ